MPHYPGKDAVLEPMYHRVEDKPVQDYENDDEQEEIPKESLMGKVKQNAQSQTDPKSRLFKDGGPGLRRPILRMVHEIHCKDRIHNKGDDQGSGQRKNKHGR